ncbi:MAG: hypothetical protein NC191_04525 [Muribaculaceae bacterium]|nr:hypothetical protein [Muribaculaceae bacterium]
MANLDKLLKRIEKNKETENETTLHELTIAGETFDVITLTRTERQSLKYTQTVKTNDLTVGDVVKKMKPVIYKSLQLAPLAAKAKEAGYINTYYDVVDVLFEPDEIIEIITFIMDINEIKTNDNSIVEEIEDLKKQ